MAIYVSLISLLIRLFQMGSYYGAEVCELTGLFYLLIWTDFYLKKTSDCTAMIDFHYLKSAQKES